MNLPIPSAFIGAVLGVAMAAVFAGRGPSRPETVPVSSRITLAAC